MSPRLLFVCSGNLCRSAMAAPMAVAIARTMGLEIEVDSAGTLNLIDRPAPANAIAVMREVGIDLRPHRSKGLASEHIGWADHVLVMTLDHATAARRLEPTAGGKIKLLAPYGGRSSEIDDPMGGWRPKFRRVRQDLHRSISAFVERELL